MAAPPSSSPLSCGTNSRIASSTSWRCRTPWASTSWSTQSPGCAARSRGTHSRERPSAPLPTLRSTATGSQLIVDGRPALLLGGQAHNRPPRVRRSWAELGPAAGMDPDGDRQRELGARRARGGHFDFGTVDAQITEAGHEVYGWS